MSECGRYRRGRISASSAGQMGVRNRVLFQSDRASPWRRVVLSLYVPLAAQEVLKDFPSFDEKIYVEQGDYKHFNLTEIASNELVIKLFPCS